jgi:hypothetical protein
MKSIFSIVVVFLLFSASAWAYTEGEYNNFFGYKAGYSNNGDLNRNTFIGGYAGYHTDSGMYNTFVGLNAGYYNTSGSGNVYIGAVAGQAADSASGNTFVGAYAGNNSSGSNNTFIGSRAGYSLSSGDNNIFLGRTAGQDLTTGSNKLYIDNCHSNDPTTHECNRPFIYGEFDTRILTIDGTLTMVTVATPSDLRYKKNIHPLESSLEKVMRLKGITYEWNQEAVHGAGFRKGSQIGFIAQEVEPVLPELVQTDSNGYKTMSYDKLVPVLVEAIKEQQRIIMDKSKIMDDQNKALAEQQVTIKTLIERLSRLEKIEARLNRLYGKEMTAQE